jgi:hypothetical protein
MTFDIYAVIFFMNCFFKQDVSYSQRKYYLFLSGSVFILQLFECHGLCASGGGGGSPVPSKS